MTKSQVKIVIDQRPYEVTEGKNLLEICLSLGMNLPFFCWHPALGSVGACRQCAIKEFKNEADLKGKIVMSCMTSAKEGMCVSVADSDAKRFRKSVIEWLMLNHPHDCPVCDEGGECHLQDMTVMTGHSMRRFRFKKRTYINQNLGPFINHEMNRCITCYRCVRFYRDYADGRDFNVFSSRDQVYFGRFQEGVLENEFSGNLVEVCPTGVFTDKTSKKHYTRKWDLQTAPSICGHCSVGCNTIPGERYGILRGIRNRFHPELNGYFLCDRGRFGYEYVNSEKRIREVISKIEDLGLSLSDPLQLSKTAGIGSPRASLESNFALRTLVGKSHFYSGMSDQESGLIQVLLKILKGSPVPSATLQDIENSDLVLVLGEDVTQTAPRVALSLRQSARKGSMYSATVCRTRLDDVAIRTYFAAPDDIARLGFAIAHELDPNAPAVLARFGVSAGLEISMGPPVSVAQSQSQEAIKWIKAVAQALLRAKRPIVISGISAGNSSIMYSASNIFHALKSQQIEAKICLLSLEANHVGLGLMEGEDFSTLFKAVETKAIDTLIVLENDLFRRAPQEEVSSMLKQLKRIILLDSIATPMLPWADAVLPTTTLPEGDGTFVNYESRAQRAFRVFIPGIGNEKSPIQESWRWIGELMVASARVEAKRFLRFDGILADLAREIPVFEPLQNPLFPSNMKIHGSKIARQSRRYSGRTSMNAPALMVEPKPPEDLDSPFSFSMEGAEVDIPNKLLPRYWAPGWNSPQAKILLSLPTEDSGIILIRFQNFQGACHENDSMNSRRISPQPLYFTEVPPPFQFEEKRWLMVPLYHLFGSDELSLLAPGIQELAPKPYVAIGTQDATRLGLKASSEAGAEAGTGIEISISTKKWSPVLKIIPSLPRGVVGIPVGLRGVSDFGIDLPNWCEISKAAQVGAA